MERPMTCERSRKLLALRERDVLSPRQARHVAAHLEGCEGCRALQRELARSRRWIESAPAPPLAEEDFAAMRRGVWRGIEARGLNSRRRASVSRSLAFAATGLFAAAFGVMWLARRAPEPAIETLAPSTAPPLAAALPERSSAGTTVRPAATEAASSAAPAAPAARMARAARRRAAPAREPAFSRIEFRTANPNVRVIWLVEKGREDSSAPTAGRKQEVS
jgi:putative zinc finger protein